MLGQRRTRWANISATFVLSRVFAAKYVFPVIQAYCPKTCTFSDVLDTHNLIIASCFLDTEHPFRSAHTPYFSDMELPFSAMYHTHTDNEVMTVTKYQWK